MKNSEEENSPTWKMDIYVHCEGHKEQQKRKISDTDSPWFYIGTARKDSNTDFLY